MTVHWYRLILWFGNIPISHQAGHWRKIGWNDLGFAVFVSHSANTTGGPGRRAAATRRRTAPLHTAGSWQDQRCIHIIRARTHAHTSTSSSRQNTRVHSTHTHTHAHAHINFTLASLPSTSPRSYYMTGYTSSSSSFASCSLRWLFSHGKKAHRSMQNFAFRLCDGSVFKAHNHTHIHTHSRTVLNWPRTALFARKCYA